MTVLTCSECQHEFDVDFPFGQEVTCPSCKTVLETEMEEDEDNLYAWVIGPAKKEE